jgi:hypothetical protein
MRLAASFLMQEIEQLPWRVDRYLARAIGPQPSTLEVCPIDPEALLPSLRCVFVQPATATVSVMVRVHSRAGIPLATAAIDVNKGDREFKVSLALLAMEGYAHIGPAERQAIHHRVWQRRAYATGSVA